MLNRAETALNDIDNMDLENAQVQMRKGILEYCILHIISRGEIYASEILDELINARIMVVEGTLYPLLTRLKNSGLLDYKWVESTSGPPRKYYVLTETGQMFLENLNGTWNELSESVSTIISKKTK
jgi:PadR family transcriptional regulator PadR